MNESNELSDQHPCDKLLDEATIMYSCLQALVALKDYKDKYGKDKYYLKNMPIAWEYAKTVLKEVME